jgi:hypothetical protein
MAALEGDFSIAASLPISTNLSIATTVTVAFVAIAVDGARPAVEGFGRGRVQPVSLQLCQESFAYHSDGDLEMQLFSNEHILIEPRPRGPRQRIRSRPLRACGL